MAAKAPLHGPPVLDETKRKLKDIKNEDYRDACKTGYQSVGVFQHAHHIVPCCSMAESIGDYFDGKAVGHRRALYYFTNWDINAAPNLVGLPTLSAYEVSFESMRKREIDVGRPHWYVAIAKGMWRLLAARDKRTPKYPIHSPSNWGHDKYSLRVQRSLNSIWGKIDPKFKEHEPVNAKSVRAELLAMSSRYRDNLMAKNGQCMEDWDAGRFAQFRM
jgi:hypothetical protein